MNRSEWLAIAAGAASAIGVRYLAPGLLDTEYVMFGLAIGLVVFELSRRTHPTDRP